MAARKRQAANPPSAHDLASPALWSIAGGGAHDSPERSEVLDSAIRAAMAMLADAPIGEVAVISICRGVPLCDVRNPVLGFSAACPLCETITVSEDGIVGYPGSGTA